MAFEGRSLHPAIEGAASDLYHDGHYAQAVFEAGKALVETYGVKVDPTLHKEVLSRMESLDLTNSSGFVQPELSLVKDAAGPTLRA